MLAEPCKVSKPISAKRKEIRKGLAYLTKIWHSSKHWGFLMLRDYNYVREVRLGHILRMDDLPKVFPDGRPFPEASQGHPGPKKRVGGKGKRRSPIREAGLP